MLFWLKIIAPVIVVIVASVSYFKALTSNDDSADIRNLTIDLLKKVVIAAMLFLIPTIIREVLKFSIRDRYEANIICVQKLINKL